MAPGDNMCIPGFSQYTPYSYYNPNFNLDTDLGGYDTFGLQDSVWTQTPFMGMSQFMPSFGANPMSSEWQKNYQDQMASYYKFNNQMALENARMSNQLAIETAKMNKNAQAQKIALNAQLDQALNNLKVKIEDDEQTQIQDAYNKCLEVAKKEYKDSGISSDSLKTIVNQRFQELFTDTIPEAIDKNSKSPAEQGFWNGATCGLVCDGFAENNKAAITDLPVGKESKRDYKYMQAVGCAGAAGVAYILGKLAFNAKAGNLWKAGKVGAILIGGGWLFNKIREHFNS